MDDVRQGEVSVTLPSTTFTQQECSETAVRIAGVGVSPIGPARGSRKRRTRKPTPLPTRAELGALTEGELRMFVDTVIDVLAETLIAQVTRGAA